MDGEMVNTNHHLQHVALVNVYRGRRQE